MRVLTFTVLLFCALLPSPALGASCEGAAACLEQGVAAFEREDYKEAANAFDAALEAEPTDPQLLVWRGRAYGRRAERATGFGKLAAFGMARKVRESFEEAVAADPKNLDALESLFSFYLEAPGIVGGGTDKAEELIPRIAAVRPAQGERARAQLFETAGNMAAAEAALRRAIELEADEIGHVLSLASFLARRGRFDESDRLFAQGFERQPDSPRVWFSRAKALVRSERRPEEARRLLERYLRTPLEAPDAEPYSAARELLDQA